MPVAFGSLSVAVTEVQKSGSQPEPEPNHLLVLALGHAPVQTSLLVLSSPPLPSRSAPVDDRLRKVQVMTDCLRLNTMVAVLRKRLRGALRLSGVGCVIKDN